VTFKANTVPTEKVIQIRTVKNKQRALFSRISHGPVIV
jgi:hypothetical protein